MKVLCLDLEGVLVPEIWVAVARKTCIRALELTTRDVADYDELMAHRLKTMREHGLTYSGIREVIATLEPLEGAVEFLDWARERLQLVILSDTFYEFGMPLMAKLGHPFLLCHRLEIDGDFISGYQLRQADPKTHAVKAFQALNLTVLAAGDSFNDLGMLQQADAGIFFRAPDAIASQYPGLGRTETYEGLRDKIEELI